MHLRWQHLRHYHFQRSYRCPQTLFLPLHCRPKESRQDVRHLMESRQHVLHWQAHHQKVRHHL
jgi:hypothetical protein